MKQNATTKKTVSTIVIFITVALSSIVNKLSAQANTEPASENMMALRMPVVPVQMNFAGERVPLERWEIKEQWEREFLLIHSETGTVFYIIKLASRWFPLIEERLKANDIPDDFKYLCIAESNLQNLISKSKAVGFWQFMSYTAPGYNLEINKDVDERYNVLKSTEAACRYLKQAYQKFGSWTAAAASYNCGQGAYSSHAAFQRTKNYYDLDIRDETNKYIFRILTFKHLMENKEKYGYSIERENTYQPFATKTIRVTSSIPDLARFALSNATTYKMLRILNPWIRGRSLIVKGGREYDVLLPVESK